MISGIRVEGCGYVIPSITLQYPMKFAKPTLVILDDVWSLSVLEQLIFRIPGCKILVVSRFKFPQSVINCTYDLELLREDEAMSLFCHYAFGNSSIPHGMNKNLVEQVRKYFAQLLNFLRAVIEKNALYRLWMSAKGSLWLSRLLVLP